MNRWFAMIDGVRAGPFDVAELRRRVDAGEVGPEELVSTENMDDWRPAGRVIELGSAGPINPATPQMLSYASPKAMPAHFAAAPQVRPDAGPFMLLSQRFTNRQNGPWVGAVVASPLAIYLLKRKRPAGIQWSPDATRTCALGELPPAVRDQLDPKGQSLDKDVIVVPRESISRASFKTLEQALRLQAGPFTLSVTFSLFSAGSIRRFLTEHGWKLNTDIQPTMAYPFGGSMGQPEPEPLVPETAASNFAKALGFVVMVIVFIVVKVFVKSLFTR